MYDTNKSILFRQKLDITGTINLHIKSQQKKTCRWVDCCSNLENKNALVIEMRKHFTEAATESVLQICVWYLLLKSLKNVCEGVRLSRYISIFFYISIYFKVYFKDFHLNCKTVMLRNSFSLKHLSMALRTFELIVARTLQGYVCLRK